MRTIVLAAVAAAGIGLAGVSGVSAVPTSAAVIDEEAGATSSMTKAHYYYRDSYRYYRYYRYYPHYPYYSRGCPDWRRESGLC